MRSSKHAPQLGRTRGLRWERGEPIFSPAAVSLFPFSLVFPSVSCVHFSALFGLPLPGFCFASLSCALFARPASKLRLTSLFCSSLRSQHSKRGKIQQSLQQRLKMNICLSASERDEASNKRGASCNGAHTAKRNMDCKTCKHRTKPAGAGRSNEAPPSSLHHLLSSRCSMCIHAQVVESFTCVHGARRKGLQLLRQLFTTQILARFTLFFGIRTSESK